MPRNWQNVRSIIAEKRVQRVKLHTVDKHLGGEPSVKALHCIGWLLLVLAVAGVEGGGFSILQGMILGIAGNALALATRKGTGWYYE